MFLKVQWQLNRIILPLFVVIFIMGLFIIQHLNSPYLMGQQYYSMIVIVSVLILISDILIIRVVALMDKKENLQKYLTMVFLFSVYFQMLFDVVKLIDNPIWITALISVMYNLSFCMLFLMAFLLGDVLFLDLLDNFKSTTK